jgi:1,4-dihydroxy-2-naphthoate octaprenyltransferase
VAKEGGQLNNLIAVTRPNFLPLTVVIVLAGLAAAFYTHHVFSGIDALLVMAAALLTHASVNAFNNYFDYKSGIDEKTPKTPFSGGVELLVSGALKPSSALAVSIGTIVAAALIGTYFLSRFFNALFPIILFGAITIVLYSPIISKIPGLSEIVAGSGFGFMGLGTYVTQTGIADPTAFSIFVPVTILVAMLLFLNEFPDADVDKEAGRRHVVILVGRKRSSRIYVAALIATYASIILSVSFRAAPWTTLISLLALPLAFRAARGALDNYGQVPKLIPAMAMNVLTILLTILLVAAGFAVAPFLQSVGF